MNLIKMQPTGYMTGLGHHTAKNGITCDVRVSLPTWPHSPLGEQLRGWRRVWGVGLREAAARAGLTAEQLSGLERGRYDLSPEDWKELRRKIGGEA